MADRAEARAKRVVEDVRRRALAAIAKQDAELAKMYDELAAGIRRDLRATGFSVAAVREILEKHFKGTMAARLDVMEKAIVSAAREARVLPQATFDAVFGEEATSAEALPFARRSKAIAKPSLRRVRASEDEPQ